MNTFLAATPRRLIVDPAGRGVYHCVSRCVRRAFLCGHDSYSGCDYEHRRGWVCDRLRELVGRFAVEIHSYAVMSNHLHAVVRTLPERVEGWDDEEVARRWLWLFPGRGKGVRPNILILARRPELTRVLHRKGTSDRGCRGGLPRNGQGQLRLVPD